MGYICFPYVMKCKRFSGFKTSLACELFSKVIYCGIKISECSFTKDIDKPIFIPRNLFKCIK